MTFKRLALTIIIAATAMGLHAAKARSGIANIRQSDGTTVTAIAHGDEHFHYYSATDGAILTMEGNSLYVAEQAEDGSIVSSGVLAHNPKERNLTERLAVERQDRTAMLTKGAEMIEAARTRLTTRASSGPNFLPTSGSPRIAVLLVEFSDMEFRIDNPKAQFETYLNTTEKRPQQDYYENFSSVRQYYIDMSFGKFSPQFDIYGPYKLGKSYKTYGAGNDNTNQLTIDACSAADNDIDFSNYDSDGDGYVDLVYIIYAGYGENSSGNSRNYIWPQSSVASSSKLYDGKYLGRYGVNNELYGSESDKDENGLRIDGIGVFCHEFAHSLGLPDLYATYDSQSSECCDMGVGYYGLMDSGEYTFYGFRPTALNCWEKAQLGWIEVEELTTPCDIKLTTVEKGGKAYVIRNEANRKECYMLEQIDNTDNNLWNRYTFGNGMLVYHIDYDETLFSVSTFIGNRVNYELGHPHFALVAADGLMLNDILVGKTVTRSSNATVNSVNAELLNRYEGQKIDAATYKKEAAGDPFPGTSNNKTFTGTSLPSAFWYTGGYAADILTDITQNADGNVSFKYLGGTTDVEGIATDDTPIHNYFTIGGKHIGSNINTLPRGIYIEKGKKKFNY